MLTKLRVFREEPTHSISEQVGEVGYWVMQQGNNQLSGAGVKEQTSMRVYWRMYTGADALILGDLNEQAET